uniref:Secreted protein n=1 Tax=Caenorhabditis tropicalis TaxID=1561998 RepID=A0A1I7V3S2_9PELO
MKLFSIILIFAMLTATIQRPVETTTSENLFSETTVNGTTVSPREALESLYSPLLVVLTGLLGMAFFAKMFSCFGVEEEEPNQVAPPPFEHKTVCGRGIDYMKECPPENKAPSIQ